MTDRLPTPLSHWTRDELRPTLDGERTRLEPLGRRRFSELREAARDPRIWTWLMSDVGPDDQLFAEWFEEAIRLSDEGVESAFVTIDARSGEVVGSTRYLELRPAHRSVEIGWTWLAPGAWRTGINVEAKLLMLTHAFETLGCIRVEFKTDARNERSRAAILALGAQFEGIHRNHRITSNAGLRDSAWYSILDREWPAVRERLAARLAPRLAGTEGEAGGE